MICFAKSTCHLCVLCASARKQFCSPDAAKRNQGNYLILELGALEGVVSTLAAVLDLRGGGKGDPVAAGIALQCSRARDFT